MKLRAPCLALLLVSALHLGGAAAQAQGFAVYVNTTEDLPVEASHCLPGQVCPLRSAIERIESNAMQGVVRACYESGTPDAKPCPPLARPLEQSDPGYDPVTGKWYFEFAESGLALSLSEGGTSIDFTLDIEGWSSPADNKFVITPGAGALDHAFIIESSGNTFKGFDVTGQFGIAAFVVRAGLFGQGGSNNQFGPGLALYQISPAVGIQIRDGGSTGNRVVGSWCGIGGDGTEVLPLQDDCIQMSVGAPGNRVGGEAPSDRNVLAASTLGSGVSIAEGSHGNQVIGNWIGLDAEGTPVGLEGGVTVKIASHDSLIQGNVISGNDSAGIALYDGSYRTIIRDNQIGLGPDGETCAGNGVLGIQINNGVTETTVERNQIACNVSGGISISGRSANANELVENEIWNNDGTAIQLAQGANAGVRAPVINNVAARRVVGTAASCKGGRVEIYSDAASEARYFEGRLTADPATGLFIFEAESAMREEFVTANCTDVNANSSELSVAVPVGEGRTTPTSQPSPPTPTTGPGPSPTPGPQLWNLFVPMIHKHHQSD